jgi:hypothetical protein
MAEKVTDVMFNPEETERVRDGFNCTFCDWHGYEDSLDGNVGCPECGFNVKANYVWR